MAEDVVQEYVEQMSGDAQQVTALDKGKLIEILRLSRKDIADAYKETHEVNVERKLLVAHTRIDTLLALLEGH